MASEQIDVEDAVAGAFFTLATAVSVGFAQVNAFGVDFTNVHTTIASIDITTATVVGVAALAFAAITNEMMPADANDQFDGIYWALVMGTPIAVLLIGGWTPITDPVTNSDILGLLALAGQAGGFALVSYSR
jgi:hypothetical protein